MTKIRLSLYFLLFISTSVLKAQSPDAPIDVQHYHFAIQLSDANNIIKGKAAVSVNVLKDISSVKFDLVKQKTNDKGMLVSTVTENGKKLSFTQDTDALIINTTAKAQTKHIYTIIYQGVPADGLIISTNKFGSRTFFGDNWPNRAHNWLPCIDDPADKATVDFDVTAPEQYKVVANGAKVKEALLSPDTRLTQWHESAPISTKVMVIGVANFAVDHSGDVNGVPVYSYVFPENKVNGFQSYNYAQNILVYFNNKVGPYAYEKLANVQSKTIFGGMENASCIFYYENSVGAKDVEELMAHEIAHQWFGDAASEKSFHHLWLSEGFATFMTNVYLENKYGTEILKKRLAEQRNQIFEFEKTRFTPVVDTGVNNNYMQLLNANSYQKGGWVLHMLRRKLGEDAFWRGIKAYYAKYKNSNANTADLKAELEQASGQNLDQFFKQWLYSAGHPQMEVNWTYDRINKTLNIRFEQKQANLFEFPLEYSLNAEKRSRSIVLKDRITEVQLQMATKPTSINIDPDVNSLVGYMVFTK